MTDKELRSEWLDTQDRLDRIEKHLNITGDSRFDLIRRTSRDNLIRRYKLFACLGGGMACCSFGWINARILPAPYDHILPFLMAGYFLLAALMDLFLMRELKAINLNTMSVSTVCKLVAKSKKIHHRCMAILIPICAIILALMISAFVSNTYMIVGMSVGAVIGLAIGIFQYLKFMDDYKVLSED